MTDKEQPVATLWQHGETGRTRITMPGDITDCNANWFKAADLYTSLPAQRTWVHLLIDDIIDAARKNIDSVRFEYDFARAIEAKLKEKNT